jgi:hypothetical protein
MAFSTLSAPLLFVCCIWCLHFQMSRHWVSAILIVLAGQLSRLASEEPRSNDSSSLGVQLEKDLGFGSAPNLTRVQVR